MCELPLLNCGTREFNHHSYHLTLCSQWCRAKTECSGNLRTCYEILLTSEFQFSSSSILHGHVCWNFTVRFHKEKIRNSVLNAPKKRRTDAATRLRPRRLLWSNKRKHASSWPISSRSQAARNCMPSDTTFSFTLVTINSCRSVCL